LFSHDDWCVLVYDAVKSDRGLSVFQRNWLRPPFKPELFPENGGSRFLRIASKFLPRQHHVVFLQEGILATVVLTQSFKQLSFEVLYYEKCGFILILKFVFLTNSGSVVVKALCYKPEGRGFDSP
jgi:hypothetical protein